MTSNPAFSTPRTPGRLAALHEKVGVRSLSGSAFIFHANIFHAEIMLPNLCTGRCDELISEA
jgi:hypothetical protein